MFSPGAIDRDLGPARLANLKLYKYNAVDKSPISRYILQHYWNWAHQFFPSHMAPNLITLMGFLFIIANVILAAWVVPTLEPVDDDDQRWIYYCFAAGIWLYSTFDNVDGKQARKTNTSSPLGELFDHGCDALNTLFSAVLQAGGLASGHSQATVLLCIVEALGFYLSTQEEYHTGVLYLSYVNAPTEGIILATIVFTLSGVYGPGIWRIPIGQVFTSVPLMVADMPFANGLITIVCAFGAFIHTPLSFYTIYRACRAKGKPFLSTVIRQDFPIFLYCAAVYTWCMSPYSYILSHKFFIPFAVAIGIVFGRMASKIILAHLTKSEFPEPTVLMVPLVAGAIVANLPRIPGCPILFTPQSEMLYVLVFLVVSACIYLRWAIAVINTFCSYLHINCLTIPSARKQKAH